MKLSCLPCLSSQLFLLFFIFELKSYIDAGAMIREDISDASVIFGVKQVPIDALIPGKTYCFFSHTIKAQVSSGCTLRYCKFRIG